MPKGEEQMAHVSVSVNGRSYTLACDDGEEDHLKQLAGYLDHHIDELSGSMGPVGETRLMLMAGLMVADELSGALDRLTKVEDELGELKDKREEVTERMRAAERDASKALDSATERLEAIAKRLQDA